MGEPQQVSALPPPPMQYIKEYTDENIRKGLAPKPPPPIRDSYMMFGNQFQCDDIIIRPLESQGIERLHPVQFDHKRELKKLNMSILVNFLDLLDILIKSPGSIKREEKLETAERFQKHLERVVEMIQGCLASLPDDLPQIEGSDTTRSLSAVGIGCSSGQAPRLKSEPMDVEEAGASCMAAGQQDKSTPTKKRDKIWDKDAAMCRIIDEIA
ncbi:mediator of RNA polymerase II transcription subunit 7 [Solea senegalensis]|uniref:Mediator of RNA polymerase II transcription subunit 7 n=1 Tax=Solea senegalensis TaxID=28829 RepID=A0AAV6SL28_SOLSE|nr:mediator of RNA polymerase II transcription subunit 7 [Solea senegalensis]